MAALVRLTATRRSEVLEEVARETTPGFDYFLLVTLSTVICTFGLATNSAAVIIGAMLVAPLMSPILGLSLASVAGDRSMFQRGVIAVAEGATVAVVMSALLGWLVRELPFDPLLELPHEILARTHPTPFDLAIALAGGAAAAYARAEPHLSAALPGVAIATALLPPLCAAGIGLALVDSSVITGAFLLFVTNLVAISFAGIATFAFLGFRPRLRGTRGLWISAMLVLLVAVPLLALTMRFVNDSKETRALNSAVESAISSFPDAQLIGITSKASGKALHLEVTVRTSAQPSHSQVVALQDRIGQLLQRPIDLLLIDVPTIRLDPRNPPAPDPTTKPTMRKQKTSPSPTSSPRASP